MARGYTFHGDADIGTADLRAFVTSVTGAPVNADGAVVTEGMYITAYRQDDEEGDRTAALGFREIATIGFRFYSNTGENVQGRSVALMVSTVLAYFHTFGGSGALLFNFEEITLQRLDDEIEIDRDWRDEWLQLPEAASVVAPFPARALPQPLL